MPLTNGSAWFCPNFLPWPFLYLWEYLSPQSHSFKEQGSCHNYDGGNKPNPLISAKFLCSCFSSFRIEIQDEVCARQRGKAWEPTETKEVYWNMQIERARIWKPFVVSQQLCLHLSPHYPLPTLPTVPIYWSWICLLIPPLSLPLSDGSDLPVDS